MKTTHQFARELMETPDIPIFHFDPSLASFSKKKDRSLNDPNVEIVEKETGDSFAIITGDIE